MGFRDKMRRLEKATHGKLEYIELSDGSRYWYDPEAVGIELFLYGVDCLRANSAAERPEPPEMYQTLTRAGDRRAAFDRVHPDGTWPLVPFDVEALVERGELVHRSMVAGKDVDDPVEDLSE